MKNFALLTAALLVTSLAILTSCQPKVQPGNPAPKTAPKTSTKTVKKSASNPQPIPASANTASANTASANTASANSSTTPIPRYKKFRKVEILPKTQPGTMIVRIRPEADSPDQNPSYEIGVAVLWGKENLASTEGDILEWQNRYTNPYDCEFFSYDMTSLKEMLNPNSHSNPILKTVLVDISDNVPWTKAFEVVRTIQKAGYTAGFLIPSSALCNSDRRHYTRHGESNKDNLQRINKRPTELHVNYSMLCDRPWDTPEIRNSSKPPVFEILKGDSQHRSKSFPKNLAAFEFKIKYDDKPFWAEFEVDVLDIIADRLQKQKNGQREMHIKLPANATTCMKNFKFKKFGFLILANQLRVNKLKISAGKESISINPADYNIFTIILSLGGGPKGTFMGGGPYKQINIIIDVQQIELLRKFIPHIKQALNKISEDRIVTVHIIKPADQRNSKIVIKRIFDSEAKEEQLVRKKAIAKILRELKEYCDKNANSITQNRSFFPQKPKLLSNLVNMNHIYITDYDSKGARATLSLYKRLDSKFFYSNSHFSTIYLSKAKPGQSPTPTESESKLFVSIWNPSYYGNPPVNSKYSVIAYDVDQKFFVPGNMRITAPFDFVDTKYFNAICAGRDSSKTELCPELLWSDSRYWDYGINSAKSWVKKIKPTSTAETFERAYKKMLKAPIKEDEIGLVILVSNKPQSQTLAAVETVLKKYPKRKNIKVRIFSHDYSTTDSEVIKKIALYTRGFHRHIILK